MKTIRNMTVALLALLVFAPAAYAANADNPNGCRPAGLFGQISEPFQAFEAAAAQTIAEGDPVKFDGSGQIEIAGATDSVILGFARTAVTASSAGDLIYVYSDPSTVFECQCSGTFAITMIGDVVDMEGTTGIFEVNENLSTYMPVRIVNYNPNDSVGANTRVYIQLVMSSLGSGAAGVFDDLSVLDDLSVTDDSTMGGDVTVTGAVQGGTLTDGTATLDGSGNWSAIANLAMTGNVTGANKVTATGTVTASDFLGEQLLLEATGAPTADAGNGTMAHRIVKATYDFGIHGGGVGQINIGLDAAGTGAEAIVMPAGSMIKKTYVWIETAFTSGGAATVSFDCAAPDDIIIAKAFDHADYGLATCSEGIQDGTPALMEVLAGTLAITVGTADLTAGRVHLFVEYATVL